MVPAAQMEKIIMSSIVRPSRDAKPAERMAIALENMQRTLDELLHVQREILKKLK